MTPDVRAPAPPTGTSGAHPPSGGPGPDARAAGPGRRHLFLPPHRTSGNLCTDGRGRPVGVGARTPRPVPAPRRGQGAFPHAASEILSTEFFECPVRSARSGPAVPGGRHAVVEGPTASGDTARTPPPDHRPGTTGPVPGTPAARRLGPPAPPLPRRHRSGPPKAAEPLKCSVMSFMEGRWGSACSCHHLCPPWSEAFITGASRRSAGRGLLLRGFREARRRVVRTPGGGHRSVVGAGTGGTGRSCARPGPHQGTFRRIPGRAAIRGRIPGRHRAGSLLRPCPAPGGSAAAGDTERRYPS